MNAATYLQSVKSRFDYGAQVLQETDDTLILYEEIFKWKWVATKLKITSFLQVVPQIDAGEIERYSTFRFDQAIKNTRGLPRGLQNGVVSYNVLIADHVTPDAIAFATARPPKHYSAFEFPIICDLGRGTLHYHRESIVWGALYSRFMQDYVQQHFSLE